MSDIAPETVFSLLSHDHAVFISPRGVAKIHSAYQGIEAITSLLNQREIDRDVEAPDEGVSFNPQFGIGLIAALRCCVAVIEQATEGDGFFSVAIPADEPEAEELDRIAKKLAQASKTGH